MMLLRAAIAVGCAVAATAVPWDPKTGVHMNGEYEFGNPLKGQKMRHRGTDYVEAVSPSYFSTYAQVNWDAHTVPLDAATIKKLDGKLVNFVGYEFDMVRTLPNGSHVSVPAWELYNHHYGNTIMGKGTTLVKTNIPTDHDGPMAESADGAHLFPGYKFVNTNPGKDNIRSPAGGLTAGGLIIGNGAESRKTFHYFAEGYGVMVQSPNAAAMHPMIIDTKNRALNGTQQRPTGHGIVPRAATVGPDQMYSPIHECPCTDKWHKKISSFSTLKEGTCNPEITDAKTCYAAAAELGLKPVKANMTLNSPSSPPGCSITATAGGYEIVYNMAPNPPTTCGKPVNKPNHKPLAQACNLVGQWMDVKSKGVFQFTLDNATGVYGIASRGKPVATATVQAPSVARPQGTVLGLWAANDIAADLATYQSAGAPTCSEINWGNGVVFAKMPWANNKPVPQTAPRVAGTAEDLVNITIDMDPAKDLVTLTLQGPSDVWFGAGFGYHHVSTGGADPSVGVSMVGTNWTVVVLGNGSIMERDLGNHEPGVQLPDTVTVVSNSVRDGSRTVVMTRTIAGAHSDNYKFDPNANQITYINALGGSADFEFHEAKASGVVYMLELDYPTCICNVAGDQGTIGGYSWGTQRCVGRPLGVMLDDPGWESNKRVNPTCDIKAYNGGLRCCKGGTILLDSDQNVTNNVVFEWQLKYRYYYEVVEDATKVTNTHMTSWWTEHNNGEHDVPKCDPKNPATCDYTITSNFTASQFGGCANGCTLMTMEGHCHIGCVGMELWIVDDEANPELLCNATNTYGTGDGWMNEMGYVAGSNTCIFGQKGNGLVEDLRVLHPTTKLRSIKISNSTNRYTGDMALWEINQAPLPADYKFPNEL